MLNFSCRSKSFIFLFVSNLFLLLSVSKESSFQKKGSFQWGVQYSLSRKLDTEPIITNKFFRQYTFEHPYFTNKVLIDAKSLYFKIVEKEISSINHLDPEQLYISFKPSKVDLNIPILKNAILHKSNIKLQKKKENNDYVGIFLSNKDGLWIYPKKNNFFSSQYPKKNHNFNLFIRFKPWVVNINQNILSKGIYKDGKSYNFLLEIKNQRLQVSFKNILKFTKLPVNKFVIKSKEMLEKNKLYTIYLRYSYEEHAFILIINQKIDTKHYLKDFSPKGQFYILWSSDDYSPIIVGKNFRGFIDELLLTNHEDVSYLDEMLSNSQPYQTPQETDLTSHTFQFQPSAYVSNVYQHIFSGSSISQFELHTKIPPTSSIKFLIRSSDTPFNPSINEKKLSYSFFYIEGKQSEIQKNKFKLLKIGKYFQWKTLLYPSFNGTESPKVFFIKFQTSEFLPPSRPQKPKIISAKNQVVQLRFIKNFEQNIVNKGRYHVFYGLEPYKADGAIFYQNIFPVKEYIKSLSSNNYVNVIISNQLIIDHIAYSRNNPKIKYKYPLLQNNLHYFFWITVCDNLWDPINHIYDDHQSPPSEYVTTLIKEDKSNQDN